jgi:hypothetical protein
LDGRCAPGGAPSVTGAGDIHLDAAGLSAFVRERALTGPTDVHDRPCADPHQATPEESYVGEIHDLVRNGLSDSASTVRSHVRGETEAGLARSRRDGGEHSTSKLILMCLLILVATT